jgi:hypothetical protein
MEKEEDEAAEEEAAEAESSIQVVAVAAVFYDFVLLSLLRIRSAYSLLRLAILY